MHYESRYKHSLAQPGLPQKTALKTSLKLCFTYSIWSGPSSRLTDAGMSITHIRNRALSGFPFYNFSVLTGSYWTSRTVLVSAGTYSK